MVVLTGRFGPYRLGTLLGRGGMGEVHRAQDTSQGGREVALKVLAPHLSQDLEYRARFRRECETAARLNEPHIVPIHRYGEIDGRLFLDMQLVDGPDLAAVLLGGGPLPAERAVAVVEQVASALDAAHAVGLVHRDVKPANVLLRSPGPGRPDLAVLTDFGIALDRGTGDGHGTAEYLAPERILDAPADHRADVYALACVLFELLTGLRAFPGGEFAAQAHGHLHLRPPRPSESVPGLSPALDAVVARGMAKDPGRRFPTAGALAGAARTALTARPPVLTRRRMLVGAAVLGGLAVAGGAAATLLPRGGAAAPVTPVVTERALAVRSIDPDPISAIRLGRTPAVLVSATDDRLYSWDLVADRPVGQYLPFVRSPLAAVTELDGRSVLVTDYLADDDEGVVVALDLVRGDLVGARFPMPSGQVSGIAATTLGDRPVVAVNGPDGVLYRYHLDDGSELGLPPRVQEYPTGSPLRIVVLGGRPAVVREVSAGVEVIDLESGEPVGSAGYGVTIAELDGKPVAVAASDRVEVSDLAGGDDARSFAAPGARLVTTAVLDGRPLAITDDTDNALVIYDLRTGERVGAPMTGHQADVTALEVADLDGRPILVSASRDTSVRVWDLAVRAAG